MRPIFSPSVRVKLRSPSEVGVASWVATSSVPAAFAFFLELFVFLARGATATAVGAVVGWSVAFNSGPLVSRGPEKRGLAGLLAVAIWSSPGLSEVCAGSDAGVSPAVGFGFAPWRFRLLVAVAAVGPGASLSITTLRGGICVVPPDAVECPGEAAGFEGAGVVGSVLAGFAASFAFSTERYDFSFSTAVISPESSSLTALSDALALAISVCDCDWRPCTSMIRRYGFGRMKAE